MIETGLTPENQVVLTRVAAQIEEAAQQALDSSLTLEQLMEIKKKLDAINEKITEYESLDEKSVYQLRVFRLKVETQVIRLLLDKAQERPFSSYTRDEQIGLLNTAAELDQQPQIQYQTEYVGFGSTFRPIEGTPRHRARQLKEALHRQPRPVTADELQLLKTDQQKVLKVHAQFPMEFALEFQRLIVEGKAAAQQLFQQGKTGPEVFAQVPLNVIWSWKISLEPNTHNPRLVMYLNPEPSITAETALSAVTADLKAKCQHLQIPDPVNTLPYDKVESDAPWLSTAQGDRDLKNALAQVGQLDDLFDASTGYSRVK